MKNLLTSPLRRLSTGLSVAVLALTTVAFVTPAEAGRRSHYRSEYRSHHDCLPTRSCGSHRHHHSHVWCSGHRDFRCPGHR